MTRRCCDTRCFQHRMVSNAVGNLKHIPSLLEASTEHSIADIEVDMLPRGYDFIGITYFTLMVSKKCKSQGESKAPLVRCLHGYSTHQRRRPLACVPPTRSGFEGTRGHLRHYRVTVAHRRVNCWQISRGSLQIQNQ
jgi:hypothetical protein